MNRTFTIASRFHPAYSVFGRWIRHRSADGRVGESTYIVAAATLGMGLLVSQFLTWAYLLPSSPLAMTTFFSFQFIIAATYAGVALAGRQPAQHVEVISDGLRIERHDEALFVSFQEISSVSIISAQVYYAHYRRFAESLAFVNRIHARLLMLETPRRPVILGLEPVDLLEMDRILADRVNSSYPSPRVGAA